MSEAMTAYGSRERSLPAPARTVFTSLVDPHGVGTRPWLRLLDDEVEPQVLESTEHERVVWSSLWPSRPRDRVVLEIADDVGRLGSRLRFTLLTPDDPPDQSRTGHLRHRMNHLLFADLRFSYGQ